MYRNIYIFFAWICVGAAFLGIFLPLLPTTPFLLLAVYLYMRSSKSGIKMILRNRYAVVQHGNMHCNFPRQAARTDYAFCDSRRSLHSPVLQKKRQKACPKRERKAKNQEKRFATFVTKSFTDMANRMIPKNLRSTNITPLPRNLSISSSLESTT